MGVGLSSGDAPMSPDSYNGSNYVLRESSLGTKRFFFKLHFSCLLDETEFCLKLIMAQYILKNFLPD